jgi:ABC-type multidrug transport system ATPase subunit
LIVGGKEKIYKIIENLKNEGYTIICITNLADEILIADRTLILKNGNIVNEIKKKELIDKSYILKENGIKEPILLEILDKLKEDEIILNMEKFTIDELICELKGKLNEKCN